MLQADHSLLGVQPAGGGFQPAGMKRLRSPLGSRAGCDRRPAGSSPSRGAGDSNRSSKTSRYPDESPLVSIFFCVFFFLCCLLSSFPHDDRDSERDAKMELSGWERGKGSEERAGERDGTATPIPSGHGSHWTTSATCEGSEGSSLGLLRRKLAGRQVKRQRG